MRSRPERRSRTRPAEASTLRCLVIAWRVTAVPLVRDVIDCGPLEPSRPRSSSRSSSPKAAKIGAALATFDGRGLGLDILPDVLHLRSPSPVVAAKRLGAPRQGDAIEARLGHGQ